MGNICKNALNDAWGVLTLKEKSVKDAAKGGFGRPMLIFTTISVIYALAALLWLPGGFFKVLISTFIGLFIASFIWFGIVWLFAKMFGGKGAFMDQYKPMSDALLVDVLSLIPFIGGLVAGIWHIVASITVVKTIHKLSSGKAVAAVLIPVAIIIVIGIILAIIAATLFAGMMGGAFANMMGGL